MTRFRTALLIFTLFSPVLLMGQDKRTVTVTTTIQAAYAEATAGGENGCVYLPPGLYVTPEIVFRAGHKPCLYGAGSDLVTIEPASGNQRLMRCENWQSVNSSRCDNPYIGGFTIKAPASGSDVPAIETSGMRFGTFFDISYQTSETGAYENVIRLNSANLSYGNVISDFKTIAQANVTGALILFAGNGYDANDNANANWIVRPRIYGNTSTGSGSSYFVGIDARASAGVVIDTPFIESNVAWGIIPGTKTTIHGGWFELNKANYGVGSVAVTAGGSGYTSAPAVSFTGGSCTIPPTATSTIKAGVVTGVAVTQAGYCSAQPTGARFIGGGGSGATAILSGPETDIVPRFGVDGASNGDMFTGTYFSQGLELDFTGVFGVSVNSGGTGYSSAPLVSFNGTCSKRPTAIPRLSGKSVKGVMVLDSGVCSATPTTVSFIGGGGAGAAGTVYTHPVDWAIVDAYPSAGRFSLTGMPTGVVRRGSQASQWLTLGCNYAGSGTFRLCSGDSIIARNAKNNGDVNLISSNTSDFVQIGGAFGGVSVDAGVDNGGSGVKHKSGPLGCSTAPTVGATCTSAAQSWAGGFPDTAYTLICSLSNPTGVPIVSSVGKGTNSFTITIAALTAASAGGDYNCVAIHNPTKWP